MNRRHLTSRTLLISVLLLAFTMAFSSSAMAAKLTMWLGYGEMKPWFENIAQDFQKTHPNFQLEVTTFPLRESERKIAVALPSGSGADLLYMGTALSLPFLETGTMLDDSPPADFVKAVEDNVDTRILDYTRYNGKIVYAPIVQSGKLFFWNKTMFKEAGIADAPTNYDEMMEYAPKLAKYDAAGNLTRSGISLRLSGQGSGTAEKWQMFSQPLGADLVKQTSDGLWTNGYNNDGGRKTLQMYIDLLHKYNADGYNVKHDSEAFALGQTAMFEREGWVIGYMQDNAPDVDYGVTYLPKGTDWGTMSAGVGGLYVNKNSRDRKLAWEFLTFALQPKYAESLILDVGWTAAFRKNIDLDRVLSVEPKLKAELDYPEGYKVWFTPKVGPYDELQTKLADQLVRLFRDKSLVDNPDGIANAIQGAADETDQILKEYGLYGGK